MNIMDKNKEYFRSFRNTLKLGLAGQTVYDNVRDLEVPTVYDNVRDLDMPTVSSGARDFDLERMQYKLSMAPMSEWKVKMEMASVPWQDDAGNGCGADYINAEWCAKNATEKFQQPDGGFLSACDAGCFTCAEVCPTPEYMSMMAPLKSEIDEEMHNRAPLKRGRIVDGEIVIDGEIYKRAPLKRGKIVDGESVRRVKKRKRREHKEGLAR